MLGLMRALFAALSACAPCLWAQFVVPQATTAVCSIELRPAQAVIMGGVSASGLKPADVAAQLDRQMEIFERAVRDAHGVLTQLERVRAIATTRGPNDTRSSTFEVVQRVRVEFAAGAPVDAILSQLLLIGLDRFGDNVENNSGRQTSMPLRYTFGDFGGEMQAFREKCRMQAEKQFCSEHSEQCTPGPPKNAAANYFMARSEERVLRVEGGSNYLEWIEAAPGRGPLDRSDPQLLGNITVHMKGYYSFAPMVMAP